ncbi:MAG: VOC family protein [Gammaproteobacteria bacterium]|jgi:catechol 2,3-dioxygenase-like lactoylglutathione lyase family enzyme|nr:VOC family protein [Gammaproteobacteria bacterium]MBU0826744.1 VOC family protein [Gammaproteobacteria bacterium]MBU0892082.1 VOC family protein [Gammaproteobacteria bacterium]MBU1353293.1 VOC family protein [Gammaproteobacteria bacterium]MBU1507794.1 VOC family protein [Gammaproteobacteria bacterium]
MLPIAAASAGAAVQSTVPVLASLNLAETLQFYTRHLGFAPLLEMDNYLILQRDGCELHFWPCNERHIAENTSCYVRANTGVLHADFAARGLQVAPPIIQPWGMKEMYVIDPHGNLLKFGEPA